MQTDPFDQIFSENEQDIQTELPETEQIEGELSVDMFKTEDGVIIQAPVAGIDPDQVNVSVAENELTVSGERKNKHEVRQENYIAQECYWGRFSRTVSLPGNLTPENAKASLKNGILTVHIPYLNKTAKHSIRVQEEN